MAIVTEVVRVIKYGVFDLTVGLSGGDKYLNSVVTGMVDLYDKSGTMLVRVEFENNVYTDIYNFDEFITCPVSVGYKKEEESGETSLEKCNWNDRQPCKELTEKLKRFSDSGYDIHLKLKCTDGVFRSIRDIEEAKCKN